MKISVITVLNTVNYGSALQSVATQKFFEEMGLEVEFVDYWRKDQTVSGQIKYIIFDKKKTIKQWIKKPVRDILRIISVYRNNKKFTKFINDNIHLTPHRYYSYEDMLNDVPEADIYCTGSDQMWNSTWNQGIEKSFFLEYAPEGKRRIAFATSIGKTAIDEEEAAVIVPMIKKYDLITMREQTAVDLLGKYGISSTNILDPTLLFNKKQWEPLMADRVVEQPYLLVYQLHQKHADADFTQTVKKIAKEKNLQIVRIAYTYADKSIGKKIYNPTVNEFLSLINYADYIVTDSFHGTAFSINLNKQFSVIYPESYSTRMDSLLKLTNLQSRHYITGEYKDEEIDYSNANEILEQRRKNIRGLFSDYLKDIR